MLKTAVLLLGLASGAIASAASELPTPGGSPRMEFRTIPVEGAPSQMHKVTSYRVVDKIVTVWNPIYGGQKPITPMFSIQGDKLLPSCELSASPTGAARCTLASQFDVMNVLHRELAVHVAAGPEPYVVSALRKCPNFNPASQEI